jgi:putative FmdB family regulatory protein
MPIFEYKCRKCDKKFEHLVVPSTKDEEPQCPNCKSKGKNLEQQISLFATQDENVTKRHMDWVRKESDNLRGERIAAENRIANES